jgi:hypothetical protein
MEFLVINFDHINSDPDKDRRGCMKRGMVASYFPDGKTWGSDECLPKFVIIKVPNLTESEINAYEGFRKQWREDIGYEITAQNANQGWYNIRVWEKNVSVSGLNKITTNKATKISDFLIRWGCENIVVTDNQITFRIQLWNAIRTVEFWDILALQFAQISFVLNSYSNGIGNITITTPENWPVLEVVPKIENRGGTIVSIDGSSYTFTIPRAAIVPSFVHDIRIKVERLYMFMQYRFNTSTVDAAVINGGTLILTKEQLLNSIINSMNA